MATATTHFGVTELHELRRQAMEAWQRQLHTWPPSGWSISPVDVNALIACSPHLWLRPGLTLRAYQFFAHGDGNSLIWALPTDAAFPPPGDCSPPDPPRPPQALASPLDALDGDGSPASYLHASILARELAGIGALGHGSEWATERILDASPWPVGSGQGSSAEVPEDEWDWYAEVPDAWQPAVMLDGDVVEVRFYTYSELGRAAIIGHCDRYHSSAYTFHASPTLLAEGPLGYVV